MTNYTNDELAQRYLDQMPKHLSDAMSDLLNDMIGLHGPGAPVDDDTPGGAWDLWYDENICAATRAYLAALFGAKIERVRFERGYHVEWDDLSKAQ